MTRPRLAVLVALIAPIRPAVAQGTQGDFIAREFQFASGETLPRLTLHYTVLGQPQRDSHGVVRNAVLVLHGTGGTGRAFLAPTFAGVLFGPGRLLDTARYFVVLPDGIGHGGSSKPSDGLRARFPRYTYDDMVKSQYLLLTEGLGVNHLRLVMGTSMGCMHSWVWGYTYPDFMDGLVPLACVPAQIAGLNRIRRKMIIDDIRLDPAWQGGDYSRQPEAGVKAALQQLYLMSAAPLVQQRLAPTRDAADSVIVARERKGVVGNDDIRPAILALDHQSEYKSDGMVRLRAELAAQPKAVRPSELLAALAVNAVARVRRTHQWTLLEGFRSEPLRADQYGDVAGAEAASSADTFAAAGAVMGR